MRTIPATSPSNNTPRKPLVTNSSYTSTALFYEDDSGLLDTLAEAVCTALMAGNSAMVVATAAHHTGLFARLKSRCIDAYAAIFEARLFLMDAEETLARFMVDGQPDPTLFAQTLNPNIAQLAANARGVTPSIFMFGEVAALLWDQGRHDAALQLEKLRNQLLASCSANVICGYPARLFAAETHAHPAAEISAHHSRVIPPQNRSGPLSQEIDPTASP